MSALSDTMLSQWWDYFLLVGTSAATLLGLLFVSISFNAEIILNDAHTALSSYSRQAFQSYVFVLVVVLAMKFPGISFRQHALMLAGIGVLGLAWSAYQARKLFAGKLAGISLWHIMRRLLPMMAGYVAVIGGAWWACACDAATGLAVIGVALLNLLLAATATSWDLLVMVGKLRQRPRGDSQP